VALETELKAVSRQAGEASAVLKGSQGQVSELTVEKDRLLDLLNRVEVERNELRTEIAVRTWETELNFRNKP